MLTFNELNELPGWLKTSITLLLGAGTAKLLAVWLESRRLEKKEYRDTLLGRIRELEKAHETTLREVGDLRVKIALLDDENKELKDKLAECIQGHAQQGVPRQGGGSDAKPASSV